MYRLFFIYNNYTYFDILNICLHIPIKMNWFVIHSFICSLCWGGFEHLVGFVPLGFSGPSKRSALVGPGETIPMMFWGMLVFSRAFFCFRGRSIKTHSSFLIRVHQINYSILYTPIFLKPRIWGIKQMIDWFSGDEQNCCQFWSWVTYESGGEISRIVWSFLWWLMFPGFL